VGEDVCMGPEMMGGLLSDDGMGEPDSMGEMGHLDEMADMMAMF